MQVSIKICGIKDAVLAQRAEALGAAYLGFIFAARSPRYVTPEAAAAIVATLSGRARRVGVFTTAPVDEILSAARRIPLDVVQLHSLDYGADEVRRLKAAGLEVWMLEQTLGDAVLIDGAAGDQRGGTGRRADWQRAAELAAAGRRVVLAGGLSAANIQAAAETGCAILDVNSSLETAPGVKSMTRLEALFQAVIDSSTV